MSGSWEESRTLHNRGEIKINFLPVGLTLRGEVLDRRTLNFKLGPPQGDTWGAIWGDPDKAITHFLGGLYHKPTGSRLLFGVLDEWGLPARIRNPWIRSPPYTENHKPVMVDIKTTASSTKEDEIYLYLSSPLLIVLPNVKLRSFFSAQTETENPAPAFSGGVDFSFPRKTGLLLETFYTGATLPPVKKSSWFSYPPPLPERDFKLYAAGLLFYNQLFSVSSDIALSETFAWGTDVYMNFGISLTPLLNSSARISRPLTISLAADGAGERFVYRDGVDHGEGFRSAAKIELKGKGSSLLRLNTVLRSPGFGESFNRSSTGFYYRFPANRNRNDIDLIRFTRVSLTADRNANNLLKINDRLSGYIGLSFNLRRMGINTPLGLNISGSVRGLTTSENFLSPYPIPEEPWRLDTAGINWELTASPSIFQFRSKLGYSNTVKNDENNEKWDFSVSTAARFKQGRFSFKVASAEFPEKWSCNVSWRLEKR
jgi:hypothetical protein